MNPRRLYRCRENRQIAGVAAGMAEYLEIDPTVIRIAWILSAFLGGFTILLYIILAFVIPLEPIALGASAAAPGSAPEAATASGSPNEIPAESPAWAHAASAEGSPAHAHERRPAENRPGQFGLVLGVLFVVFGAIALVGPMFPGWSAGHRRVIFGGPLLVLGLLLVLGALLGAQVAGQPRGAVATFILSPIHPATWRATGAIVAGFVVEMVAFSAVASVFSAGVSLLVVGVGIVVVGIGIEACRLVARFERSRAASVDRRPLLAHPYRRYGSGLRDLANAIFLDVNRWRDVVYVFIAFPLAVLEFIVVIALWTLAIGLLSMPLWFPSADLPFNGLGLQVSRSSIALVGGLIGLVLAPVAATVAQGLMTLHRAVVAGLLCESEQRALERRVESLEVSRKAVIDVEAGELRRIERDLHDGAQQRLVMLTIDLGLAAERIDTDPAKARELVEDARDQARLALAELRDLVRGIAPPILLDRGLVPALSALAGRCPIPTAIESALPDGQRLPDAVERAAYFVVAEALANVAKHATAAHCEVRVRREARSLVVEIRDDGTGGARIIPGGGLAGLAGRVDALDGALTVASPPGGPTLVRAEIPSFAG